MSDIYEALENESLEYSIYALDKTISKAEAMNPLLSEEAKIANSALIKQHEAKRSSLLDKLKLDEIDWDKIKVIHSIESKENIDKWTKLFSWSIILA